MNNFLVRTIAGAVFLALMVCGMLFHPLAFGVLFLVAMYMAMREFLHITLGERYILQQKLAILSAAVAFIVCMCCCFYGLEVRFLTLALIPLFALALSVVLSRSHDTVEDVAVFFIIIWCADVGAYSLGTLFGQKPDSRKLAPAISPKKSWWGFWGGIAMAVLGAFILYLVGWMDYPLVHCLILGALVAVTGVCGDLFESVWKRRYGFKDSGNCIPGHGGMLDRFDSSLFAIPSVFVYLALSGLL